VTKEEKRTKHAGRKCPRLKQTWTKQQDIQILSLEDRWYSVPALSNKLDLVPSIKKAKGI